MYEIWAGEIRPCFFLCPKTYAICHKGCCCVWTIIIQLKILNPYRPIKTGYNVYTNNDNARVYRREHPLILECKLWPSRAFFIWFLDSGSVKDSLQCFYHLRENFFLCLVAINQQLIDTYCVVKGKFILLFTKNFQEKFSEWVAKSPLIEYNKSEPKAPCSGT